MQKMLNTFVYKSKVSLSEAVVEGKIFSSVEVNHAAEILKKYGFVVIKNFYDHQKAIELGEKLKVQVLIGKEKLQQSGFVKTKDYYVQTDLEHFKNYAELAKAEKPVLNIRSNKKGNPDGGFVDFFSIDKLLHNNRDFLECKNRLRSSQIKEILSSVTTYPNRQMNLYFNQAIRIPRGPHLDNLNSSYKCFLYLTDVEDNDVGPFTYVPESHKKRLRNKFNVYLNLLLRKNLPTDIPVSASLPIPILGKAGTLIISCQSGVHGGLPQVGEQERVVLVDNYF